MEYFPKNLFCAIRNLIEMPTGLISSQSAIVGTGRIVPALMFRSIARVAVPVGVVSFSVFALVANAQISPNLPNPIGAPNPLTTTLSIFRSNMQDKIMKAADAMPESKYSYRPTKDVRSFGEIVTHVADISYYLCSNAKGEAAPPRLAGRVRRRRSWPTSKARSVTATSRSQGLPMLTSMTRRTSGASRRTRCSS